MVAVERQRRAAAGVEHQFGIDLEVRARLASTIRRYPLDLERVVNSSTERLRRRALHANVAIVGLIAQVIVAQRRLTFLRGGRGEVTQASEVRRRTFEVTMSYPRR